MRESFARGQRLDGIRLGWGGLFRAGSGRFYIGGDVLIEVFAVASVVVLHDLAVVNEHDARRIDVLREAFLFAEEALAGIDRGLEVAWLQIDFVAALEAGLGFA